MKTKIDFSELLELLLPFIILFIFIICTLVLIIDYCFGLGYYF